MGTLEQERAKFAWEKVQGQSEDYRNLVKSLPAMIMTNGLMQTLAFLEGKGKGKDLNKNPHKHLMNHIIEWLEKRGLIEGQGNDFGKVMGELYSCYSQEYQRITEEVLALLRWLRQLVDAAIKKS